MATQDQIEELRRMINADSTVTDQDLGDRIDAVGGDLSGLASIIWSEKAATYSYLVDIKEGSSSRNLGSLYKNALEMAAFYGSGGGGAVATNVARTRQAVREGGY
jgi:hypothetical protein